MSLAQNIMKQRSLLLLPALCNKSGLEEASTVWSIVLQKIFEKSYISAVLYLEIHTKISVQHI